MGYDMEKEERILGAFKPHYIEQPQAASTYVRWTESES